MHSGKYILALGLFIIFTGAIAQSSYNKFVVDGVGWVITENICTTLGGPCDAGNPGQSQFFSSTYYFKTQGTTLVDSILYENLLMSFCKNSCIGCGPPSGPPFTPGCSDYQLVALLREDTINRKVYARNFGASNCWMHYDSLFIDFSLAAGDSENMAYVFTACDTNEVIVDSINNTGFQNYPVKTWHIRNTFDVNFGWGPPLDDFQLYEGIGYSYGFSLLYDAGDGSTYARQLIKYCPAGDNSCASPYRPNDVPEISASDMDIMVLPNPASDFLSIKSVQSLISKVEILDLNGRTILASSLSELNISSLAPAVYFLQVQTNLGVAYKRFVKI